MTKERESSTFADYCENWLSAKSSRLKASSCAKYRAEMDNHIKPYFKNKQLCEITTEKINAFTQMLLCEKGLSAKTVRAVLTLFRSVFIYTERRTGQKPQMLEIVYPKECKRTVRVLNENEEEILMKCLAREMNLDKFGIYLSLRTGMRIGEVCALRWRDIPLMPDIAKLCTRFYPGIPDAFVLTGTEQCMEPRKLQRRLKKYTEACKLKEVHFHTLRHTFATRCIEVGFDVKTLSEILGHSNVSVTLNQYVHPNMNLKRENMSRLKEGIRL